MKDLKQHGLLPIPAKKICIILGLLAFAVVSANANASAQAKGMPVSFSMPKSITVLRLPEDRGVVFKSQGTISGLQRADAEGPKIDMGARAVLDEVRAAYKDLRAVDLAGDFTVSVTTNGQVHKVVQPFTASFEAPNKFRHQMKPAVLLGCDGTSGYVFDEKQNAYLRYNFPSKKQAVQDLPMGVLSTLLVQNPSLLFAMTQTPVENILRTFGEVSRLQDAPINGTNYTVLQFGTAQDQHQVQLYIDSKTHLVRRFVLDLKSALEGGGQTGVENATVTVDYTRIVPQNNFAPKHFAWKPPPGSTDVLEAAGAETKSSGEPQAQTRRFD